MGSTDESEPPGWTGNGGASAADADHPGAALASALDAVCALAARLASAPTAVLAQRNPATGTIQVRGRVGTLVTEVDMSFVLPDLDPRRQPMLVVADVRRDARFEHHPLLRLMPHLKSLIAVLVPGRDQSRRSVLKIVNPSRAAMADGATMQMLSDLCTVVGGVLDLERERHPGALPYEAYQRLLAADAASPAGRERMLREDGAVYADGEWIASFLLETLVKRRALHSRNGADFLTLRTWRASLKPYQIAALARLKAVQCPNLLAAVSDEVAASVRRTHGEDVIRSVVPVPPGSSGRKESFSMLLARGVAERLRADYREALIATAPAEPGKSSPHKSARLAPYRIGEPARGPILVVDDVASSGRHLELAMQACRAQAAAVYAVAWIGG